MPTYEYVCAKCKHHFDKHQPITEKALTICPKDLCPRKTWGKGKVKRVMSAGGGLIFKGSGFYITDYRSEGYKAAAKKDAAAGSASGSTDGGKKDTAATPSTGGSTESAKKESKPVESAKPKADSLKSPKSG
jgi:putative FmdB family regulatory protein